MTERRQQTDAEQLQCKVNEVVDDSLESTRRMRILCEESKEAGIRTLVALDEQGEQLDRIEEDMDKINQDMREAEKALTGMEKCCGLFRCPCIGAKNDFKEGGRDAWKATDDGQVIGGQPIRTVDDRNGVAPVQGQFIARITKDAREDEMEENMHEVSHLTSSIVVADCFIRFGRHR